MDRVEPLADAPSPGELSPPVPPSAPGRPRARRWLLLGLLALLLAPPLLVLALRWLPPATTAFMLQSPVRPVDYRWVPAAQQPDSLRRAVVAAEDQKFWTHGGFDFEAIGKALEHNESSRRKRGASTISQQVAKNLFLWPGRSWLRKGLEAGFTVLIEALWPKARILEVYLNVAEFGPGVYGAEAAARTFFGKPAAKLTPVEAARLAAVLPNPRQWRAQAPGPYVQARTQWILGQIGYRAAAPAAEPLPPEPVEPLPAAGSAPPEAVPSQDPPVPDASGFPEEEEAAGGAAAPAPAEPAGTPPPEPYQEPYEDPYAGPADESAEPPPVETDPDSAPNGLPPR